jgi:hypothetical protein
MLKWLRDVLGDHAEIDVVGHGAIADAFADGLAEQSQRVHRLASLDEIDPTASPRAILFAAESDAAALTSTQSFVARSAAREKELVLAVACDTPATITALQDLDATSPASLRVRPLCRDARIARLLLLEHPFTRYEKSCAPYHPVIVGTAPLAEHLIFQLFRMMHLPGMQPAVSVVGKDAKAWVDALLSRFSALSAIGTVASAGGPTDVASATSIYVVDAGAWDSALATSAAPIYWLAAGTPPPGVIAVKDVGWKDLAAPLLSDPIDRQARGIHDLYLEERRQAGDAMNSRPSMRPWEMLPERFRSASRHQADHINTKLDYIRCRTKAETKPRFDFSSSELEALSESEHRRWEAVQRLDGWTFGEKRDDAAKKTPMLVPYEQLSQEIKDLDRLSVRAVPAQTEAAGLAIVRDMRVRFLLSEAQAKAHALKSTLIDLIADLQKRYPDRVVVADIPLGSAAEPAILAACEESGITIRLSVTSGQSLDNRAPAIARAEKIIVDGPIDACEMLVRGNTVAEEPGHRRVVVLDEQLHIVEAPWL